MITKLKAAISHSILLILIVAPYLINFLITHSFTLSFLWLIVGLLFFELASQKLSGIIFQRFRFDINVIVIPSLLLLFYYEVFVILINQVNNITIKNPSIRARYYIPIIWIILLLFYHWISPKLQGRYVVLNSFLLIFSGTIFLTNSVEQQNLEKPVSHFIQMSGSYTKPIILIILDEYSSPTELYKNKADSSIFAFNKTLISSGWQVNNEQYSYNLLTVHSLSSLFNYNFKLKDSSLSIDESLQNLRGSTLIRDLYKKRVSFQNYGIFDIGDSKAFSKIYYYDDEEQKVTFLKAIFAKSMIGLLYGSLPNSRQLYHNRFLMENGYENMQSLTNKKSFIYLHLLMPHAPIEYKGYKNFELNNANTIENYISYWHFTNCLVQEKLLKPLVESNQFKIIITGDHGYRGDMNKVNAHKTNTAYYGFDPAQVAKVKTVQDLGSLIYASY